MYFKCHREHRANEQNKEAIAKYINCIRYHQKFGLGLRVHYSTLSKSSPAYSNNYIHTCYALCKGNFEDCQWNALKFSLHFNTRSFEKSNVAYFNYLLCELLIDVICITEAWLRSMLSVVTKLALREAETSPFTLIRI